MNGDFFFALPGICGDFRDLVGTGKWGMAATGSVRVGYDLSFGSGLFAMRSAFVLEGDAKVLVALGGGTEPKCGKSTDPSGIFLKVDVSAGTSLTDVTLLSVLLGILSPSASTSVDAYLMIRQDTRLLPGYILSEFAEGVQTSITMFTNLITWLVNVGTKSTSDLMSELSSIITNLKAFSTNCAGTPSCWFSSPELSAAANYVI